jgi:hypothetical protein
MSYVTYNGKKVNFNSKLVELKTVEPNLIPAASSSFETDGTAYWDWYTGTGGTKTWDAGGFMTLTSGDYGGPFLYKGGMGTTGYTYKLSISYRSSNYTGMIYLNFGNTYPAWTTNTSSTSWQTSTGIFKHTAAGDTTFYIQLSSIFIGTLDIDNIIVQRMLY